MATLRNIDVQAACERVATECACEGLRRASRAVSKVYESAYAPFGLTATQFAILVAVHLFVRAPLSRMAERLVLDRTSLYRALKPLVRRKCLAIQPGRDRRERVAVLTVTGERLLAQVLPVWEATQRKFAVTLGEKATAALTVQAAASIPAAEGLFPLTSLSSTSE